MVRRAARRKRIISWLKKIGLTLLILLAIASVVLLGLWLFQLSNTQKWSSEVNASVINLFVSTLTFIITIAVTVYFNTKTQRLTLEVQEMNIEAMKFQARANIRDRIIEKRMEIYPEILEDLRTFNLDYINIKFNLLKKPLFKDFSLQKHITDSRKIATRFLNEYGKNPFISPQLRAVLTNYAKWKTTGLLKGEDKLLQLTKIMGVNEFLEIEHYFQDTALKLIDSELQLKEVEEDIEEMTAIWS